MNAKTSLRGIIFDMDGVLLRSSPIHDAAYREILQPFALADFQYARYAGMRTRDAVDAIVKDHGICISEIEKDALAAAKSRLALKRIIEENPIAADCGVVLALLAEHFSLALASSASRQAVDAFVNRNGLSPLFGCVLSGADVSRAKPSPEIYQLACRRLGLAPDKCLVVEDAVAGIQAAKAAGAFACGLPGTYSSDELEHAGADYIIDDIKDLLEWLPRMLPRILTRDAAGDFLASSIDSSAWTALIPAAGRGSRLGFSKAKILFEVAGQSILERLIRLLQPACDRFVFVLSPEGAADVETVLDRLLPGRYCVAVQQEPRGMADAIASGLPFVDTRNTLIIWGDQVAIRPSSIEFCVKVHQGPAQPAATCPTLLRANPYIHFERDDSGRVSRILQAREGDRMPETGESDSGLFLFQTEALRSYLARLPAAADAIGAKTGERNFLPIFPLIDEQPGALVCLRIMTEAESVGVNSKSDAEFLERTVFGTKN